MKADSRWSRGELDAAGVTDPQLRASYQRCRLLNAELSWLDAERYSARQQQAMVLGGLYGQLEYSPPDPLLWPWLRLMQHLQLGNKTTFGFGKIGLAGSA